MLLRVICWKSTCYSTQRKLSELSKKAHWLAKQYEQNGLEAREELKEVEEEVDRAVAGLYGITDEELVEVRKTLRALRGEEVER